MKTLYVENYRYGKVTHELNREAHNALKPIFEAWVKDGYNPREIAHIINGAVMDFELESVLGWDKT